MDDPGNPLDTQILYTGYHHQLISINQNDRLLIPHQCTFKPIRRLIVLIPKDNFDEIKLSKKIWQLACVDSLPILFLAQTQDQNSFASVHRRLATLAALTAFGIFNLTVRVWIGKSWIEIVKQTLVPGDLLLCLRHHTVPYLLGNKPVGEYLSHLVDTPIYLISDLHIESSPYLFSRFKGTTAWLVILVIIVAFGFTQAWISQTMLDPTSSLLLCLLYVIEFLIILGTNNRIR